MIAFALHARMAVWLRSSIVRAPKKQLDEGERAESGTVRERSPTTQAS